MLQFLIDLVMPFFTGLGVSPEDVTSYVTSLGGYIYALFGLLLAVVAVMVAAHWMVKKGTRHVVRWSAGVAWVLVATIIVNVICFGPMYNNLAPILNGGASVSEESIAASKALVKETGEEGMVLLQNDDSLLPLSNTKLNVFGWASTSPIYGGTGSGSSDSSNAIDILTSLSDAGIEYNTELIDMYTEYGAARGRGSVGYVNWSLPEPTVDHYTDTLMENAKAFSDTAMIVISRAGGEGQDLPVDMNAVIHGTYDGPRRELTASSDGATHENYTYFASEYTNNGDYDDFDPGESYLDLSNTEEAMIEKVCQSFDNVVVVINANNAMNLSWIENYSAVKSVILAPGTGSTGMAALGEILNGSVNPSGRTVDTYLYDLNDAPWVNNVGSFVYNNVQDIKDANTAADTGFQGVVSFVNYVEGIYVGYKFYETAAEEGLIDYDSVVQFPFGHGLSYTTFDQKIENFMDNGDAVSLDVVVSNTGSVPGKTAVELYFTPPYNNGGIEKASVNLIDFGKTDILEPGASQIIHFDLLKEDMASYDSRCVKTSNGGYVLEAGDYVISLRSDSHTVLAEETFTVSADMDYSKDGRSTDDAVAINQMQDFSTGTVTYLSRADHFANYDEATAAPAEEDYVLSDDLHEKVRATSVAFYDSTLYDDPSDEMPTTGAQNGVVVADLTGKSYDDPLWNDLLDELSVDDMINMVNLGGFQTVAVDSIGKVGTQDSDGTTGLNDWYIQVYGTAYSTELLIAQTWNKDLAYRIGLGYGQEYADAGIYGCYGPAMNTHRSPFCGRNFEYYSEDGTLAGYIASNMVKGLGEKGVYAYIKHFALNDQETNRCAFLLTWADEQCMREIYLKPFEMCVKDNVKLGGGPSGYPLAVMGSFNFIGHINNSANPYLLNNILRDEWGFRGMVLTDWNGSYGYQLTDECVRNGNDCMLGFFRYDSNQITNTSATMVKCLRQACKNILYTVANSGNYTISHDDGGMDNMTRTFLIADVLIAVAALGVEALVIIRWLKKRKQVEA